MNHSTRNLSLDQSQEIKKYPGNSQQDLSASPGYSRNQDKAPVDLNNSSPSTSSPNAPAAEQPVSAHIHHQAGQPDSSFDESTAEHPESDQTHHQAGQPDSSSDESTAKHPESDQTHHQAEQPASSPDDSPAKKTVSNKPETRFEQIARELNEPGHKSSPCLPARFKGFGRKKLYSIVEEGADCVSAYELKAIVNYLVCTKKPVPSNSKSRSAKAKQEKQEYKNEVRRRKQLRSINTFNWSVHENMYEGEVSEGLKVAFSGANKDVVIDPDSKDSDGRYTVQIKGVTLLVKPEELLSLSFFSRVFSICNVGTMATKFNAAEFASFVLFYASSCSPDNGTIQMSDLVRSCHNYGFDYSHRTINYWTERPDFVNAFVIICSAITQICYYETLQAVKASNDVRTRSISNLLQLLGFRDIIIFDGTNVLVNESTSNYVDCKGPGNVRTGDYAPGSTKFDSSAKNTGEKIHIVSSLSGKSVVSAQITKGAASENNCIDFDSIARHDALFVADRAHNGLIELIELKKLRNIDFVVREKDSCSYEIKEARDHRGRRHGELDALVGLKVNHPLVQKLCAIYGTLDLTVEGARYIYSDIVTEPIRSLCSRKPTKKNQSQLYTTCGEFRVVVQHRDAAVRKDGTKREQDEEFIYVVTSLKRKDAPALVVIDIYRLRWDIELSIKDAKQHYALFKTNARKIEPTIMMNAASLACLSLQGLLCAMAGIELPKHDMSDEFKEDIRRHYLAASQGLTQRYIDLKRILHAFSLILRGNEPRFKVLQSAATCSKNKVDFSTEQNASRGFIRLEQHEKLNRCGLPGLDVIKLPYTKMLDAIYFAGEGDEGALSMFKELDRTLARIGYLNFSSCEVIKEISAEAKKLGITFSDIVNKVDIPAQISRDRASRLGALAEFLKTAYGFRVESFYGESIAARDEVAEEGCCEASPGNDPGSSPHKCGYDPDWIARVMNRVAAVIAKNALAYQPNDRDFSRRKSIFLKCIITAMNYHR